MFKVSQLMTPMPAILYSNEPMEEVMRKFDTTNANVLPVVDINNKLQGYISRTRMYRTYRQMVARLFGRIGLVAMAWARPHANAGKAIQQGRGCLIYAMRRNCLSQT